MTAADSSELYSCVSSTSETPCDISVAASGAIDIFKFSTVSDLLSAFSIACSVSVNLAIISLAVISNSCTRCSSELEFASKSWRATVGLADFRRFWNKRNRIKNSDQISEWWKISTIFGVNYYILHAEICADYKSANNLKRNA